MLTREVKLHTGIKVGEGPRAMTATIREETLEDELAVLDAGLDGVAAHRAIMMRRVKQLGDLQDPSRAIVGKLTRTDWELIERDLDKLDLELSVASGLVAPSGDTGDDGGRDEPGGAAPGAD